MSKGKGTVWAVTRGDYSDYSVLCICSDKKTARHIAAQVNGRGDGAWSAATVEGMPFRTGPAETVTTYGLECEVWDDGTTTETRETVSTDLDVCLLWPEYNVPAVRRWVRAPIHNGKGGRLEVHGTDLERVRHIFSDTRAQLMVDPALRAKREINR